MANHGQEVALCLPAISNLPIIHDTKISSFAISNPAAQGGKEKKKPKFKLHKKKPATVTSSTFLVHIYPTSFYITENVFLFNANFQRCLLFLRTFAKLRKATISLVMFMRLSVHMEQLGSNWTDFY